MAAQVKFPVDTLTVRPLPRGRFIDVLPELALPGVPGGFRGEPWVGGVTWVPRQCRHLVVDNANDGCDANNISDLHYSCPETLPVQTAFSILNGLWGSTLNWDLADMDALIDEHNAIELSSVLAKEAVGATAGGSISFSNVAHPVAGGFAAGVGLTYGLAQLQNDLADTLRGGQGVIHMAPGLLHQAVDKGAAILVDGQYQTPLGHLIVADAGYIDALAPSGESASAATEEWVYATGPVAWKVTPWVKREGALNISTNYLKRLQTAFGIVVFDPCPVTAVLVDYDV